MEGSLTKQFIDQIRQKGIDAEAEDFVVDLIFIWEKIHNDAPNITLAEIKDYSESILSNVTLPFFEKFKHNPLVKKYDLWLKEYYSIVIEWTGQGAIMFPCRLINYEVFNHKDQMFEYFINKLKTGEFRLKKEDLFSFLFPRLIHVTVPLSETDILILKSLQYLQNTHSPDPLKIPKVEDYAKHLDVSTRTIIRRFNIIKFFQVYINIGLLNMSKLGYETFLLSHFDPIPPDLAKYVALSADLDISNFTIIQMPLKNNKLFLEVQESFQPKIFHQMSDRIHSWSLNLLGAEGKGWTSPPAFIHSDPRVNIINPSPDFHFDLKPGLEAFRPLTPADFKILDFLITRGAISSLKDLSRTVNVSPSEITKRIQEYEEHNILYKTYQFYNLGLDLHILFFISSPNHLGIPWLNHFLTFPKCDVFYSEENDSSFYFGFLKLPPQWIKELTRKIHRIKKEFKDIKFYYTLEPPLELKWNLSLPETYPKEN